MEEAKNLIGVCHVSNPSIPARISKSVPVTCNDEYDDQHRIWRMHRNNGVGNQMRPSADCRHSTSAKVYMYHIIRCSGTNISGHGAEKDQADDNIGDVVVLFQIWNKSAVCAIVQAENDERIESRKDSEHPDSRIIPFLKDWKSCWWGG